MNLIKIIDFVVMFLIGFITAFLLGLFFISGVEFPLFNNFSVSYNVNTSPSDYINEDSIKIYDDKIIIFVNDASLSRFASTGSMRPVLDMGSNGIRIKPKNENDINIGDIITFRDKGILVVHRVVNKGIDDKGVYFITKGDNNLVNDGKIRFKDIEYKTIAVIY